MTITETKIKETFKKLKSDFSWKNPMQAPKIEKIIVSVGTGRVRKEKQKIELIQDRLAKITGQKAVPKKAKKSIASIQVTGG